MVRGVFQNNRPSPFLERLGDSAEKTDADEINKPLQTDKAAELFAQAYEKLFGKEWFLITHIVWFFKAENDLFFEKSFVFVFEILTFVGYLVYSAPRK